MSEGFFIDHVIYGVQNVDVAAKRLRREFGLGSVPGGLHLGGKALLVDLAVAGNADRQGLPGAVGVAPGSPARSRDVSACCGGCSRWTTSIAARSSGDCRCNPV